MDLESAKNIAAIAAPFSKIVLETFLVPKFQEIRKKWKRDGNLIDYAFEEKFTDYLNETYEKNAILNTLAFKKKQVLLSEVYVPLQLYCAESKNTIKIDNYSEEIFQGTNKVLITDTAGMGKSTLSRKLLISCLEINEGVPVLIELRRLSDSKGIIDEIIEQLNPINESIDQQFILDLIKRGDFIFFFDGFDEIALSQRSKVTTEIQKFISKARKNKFVLTSRPEDSLSSFGDFKKYQIRPLKPKEAHQLIRNYDPDGNIGELLISKIKEKETFNSVKDYLTTPLLVSLLFTAFEHKQRIPFKKHIFYRQVFDALFESHDLSKGDSFEREKYTGLGSDEFHRVLRIFGFLCLQKGNKIEFSKDELTKVIQRSIDLCSEIDIKSSDFIKDLLITVPLFTIDGTYYKWSHKSLQEYFAAQYIYFDSKEKQESILLHISFHEENDSFINIIDLYRSMDPGGFESVVTYKLLCDFIDHMENSYSNFNGNSKQLRQELTFGYTAYLINNPFKPKSSKNDHGHVFKLVRDYTKFEGYKRLALALNVVPEEDISFIKAPRIKKPAQVLVEFFHDKESDFIKTIPKEKTKKLVSMKLKKYTVYKVSDRKNSLLNNSENFDKTNIILRLFIGRFEFLTIDLNKARKSVQNLTVRKDQNFKDELLNF